MRHIDTARVAREILDGTHGVGIFSTYEHTEFDAADELMPELSHKERQDCHTLAESAIYELRDVYQMSYDGLFLSTLNDALSGRVPMGMGYQWIGNVIDKAHETHAAVHDNRMLAMTERSMTEYLLSYSGSFHLSDIASCDYYIIAYSLLSASIGVLRHGKHLPRTNVILVFHPDFLEDKDTAEAFGRLRENSTCYYNEKESGRLNLEAPRTFEGLPSDVYSEAVYMIWNKAWNSMAKNPQPEHDPHLAGIAAEVLFAERQMTEDEHDFMIAVDKDIRSRSYRDESMRFAIQQACCAMPLESFPPAYRALIERIAVMLPLYLYIVDSYNVDTNKRRHLDTSMSTIWEAYCGDEYLKAIAAGVPLEDVVA